MIGDAAEADSRFGVLLTVAYEGGSFHGLARQGQLRTVAGEIERTLSIIDPGASPVRAVSRTDAGVHARAQMMAFDAKLRIPLRGWVLGLTRLLPTEIAIVRAARVDPGFDPRDHVVSKTYCYLLLLSKIRDPFLQGRSWRITDHLNLGRMRSEAQCLAGDHDFAAFRNASDARRDTRCRLNQLSVQVAPGDPRIVQIEIEGDRFLYKMVRIIAGSLVDVGRGRLRPGRIGQALAGGSRADLGITAPPDGLYLEKVILNDTGLDSWPDPGGAIDEPGGIA